MGSSSFTVPRGFLWAAATSAHQVEGGNIHSDWWAWEQAGRVAEPSGAACEHYQRYAQDFDLAASLGHTAHRFSIEWSRLEPSEGAWDDQALAHYVDVVRALRARGLEPLVTLHHFTTPQWLVAEGGWAAPKSVEAFLRYAGRVAGALRGLVKFWITINEPMVYVNMHYVEGVGPPGAHSLRDALRVTEHLIRAHAGAYRILHEASGAGDARVSIAKHAPVFVPCRRWHPGDLAATAVTDRVFNGAMLEALTTGRWSVPGVAAFTVPDAAGTLDFLGINFYGRQFIRLGRGNAGWKGCGCDLGHHPREVPERTSMGWDVHPDSFTRTLLRWRRLKLPIIVTENGTTMADDADRWRFILRHLQAAARAMEQGADIIGFCVWSLLDNFEWAQGYGPRFGVIEVDYQTQARRVRDSARRYADVCRSNAIPLDVV
ncbi:MAG TPA: family 1 glycosylhydrolase [bacterium]